MRIEILCLIALSMLATIIVARPALEDWHDRLGIGSAWQPTGTTTISNVDAHGRALQEGEITLVVLSDCGDCSFRTIPYQRILELQEHGSVLVLLQNPISDLSGEWQEAIEGVHVIEGSKANIPIDWIVHAPFEGQAIVELGDDDQAYVRSVRR